MSVGAIAVGAVGCAGAQSEQQQWVIAFLKRPVGLNYSGGTLKWTSDNDRISFQPK